MSDHRLRHVGVGGLERALRELRVAGAVRGGPGGGGGTGTLSPTGSRPAVRAHGDDWSLRPMPLARTVPSR
jgi:hypothetical protein